MNADRSRSQPGTLHGRSGVSLELVRAYSDPPAGRHSLQIEINKRLYMDETTLAKTAGFAALQKDLAELLRAIAGYR